MLCVGIAVGWVGCRVESPWRWEGGLGLECGLGCQDVEGWVREFRIVKHVADLDSIIVDCFIRIDYLRRDGIA